MIDGSQTVVAAALFDAGADLLRMALAFLALLALVVGAASAIRMKGKEGTGAAIAEEIGAIVLAVIIFCSAGIGLLLTREVQDAGVPVPSGVDSPWGR